MGPGLMANVLLDQVAMNESRGFESYLPAPWFTGRVKTGTTAVSGTKGLVEGRHRSLQDRVDGFNPRWVQV